jgi:hypothetical protein
MTMSERWMYMGGAMYTFHLLSTIADELAGGYGLARVAFLVSAAILLTGSLIFLVQEIREERRQRKIADLVAKAYRDALYIDHVTKPNNDCPGGKLEAFMARTFGPRRGDGDA